MVFGDFDKNSDVDPSRFREYSNRKFGGGAAADLSGRRGSMIVPAAAYVPNAAGISWQKRPSV